MPSTWEQSASSEQGTQRLFSQRDASAFAQSVSLLHSTQVFAEAPAAASPAIEILHMDPIGLPTHPEASTHSTQPALGRQAGFPWIWRQSPSFEQPIQAPSVEHLDALG